MRVLRFGSYSIVKTFAGTFDFLLKSTRRYFRLCPPPHPLTVITPRLFLPLIAFFPKDNVFSGFVGVKSLKYETDFVRVPGL